MVLSGSEGLLKIVGLRVAAEGVRASTHLKSWRERVLGCKSSNTETTVAKRSAIKQDGK